jgi:MFS family permease
MESVQLSVESSRSWVVASAVLVILMFSFGSPMVVAVGLKEIAADIGSSRSIPALAGSLVWLGSGLGGIGYGWLAERIGFRATTLIGAGVIALGLWVSSMGGSASVLVGHGLLLGVLGCGAINIPLVVYASRWFDRRRGSALAYLTSGQHLAGLFWPSMITLSLAQIGWRQTMIVLGLVTAAVIAVLAILFVTPAPERHAVAPDVGSAKRIGGPPSNLVYGLLCLAGFLCCTPMAMPPAHVVALCSDLGIRPSQGALMLSILLGSALVSRQFWGWLADRYGGLVTILSGSVCQALAIIGFAWTQDEAGLFLVSAAFGLGYSGIIPAYVVALREHFPADEASWRIPVWYTSNLVGMALGGWLAGYIYDQTLSYQPAFITGVLFNIANIAVLAWLIWRIGVKQPTMAIDFRDRQTHPARLVAQLWEGSVVRRRDARDNPPSGAP